MAIALSTTQSEIQISSTSALQAWQMPVVTVFKDYYQGAATPAPFDIAIKFRDIIGTIVGEGYSEWQYRSFIEAPGNIPAVLTISGPLASNGAWVSYHNGLNGNHTFTWQNLNLLQPGTYTFTVKHQIRATINGAVHTIDSKQFTIQLRVFSSAAPVVTPFGVNITWIDGGASAASSTMQISGPSWNINAPAGFYFFNVDGAVVNNGTTDWGGSSITGSGTKTIQLLMLSWAVPDEVPVNPLVYYLEVNGGLLQVPLTITFLEESGMFIQYHELQFEALRGITEAEPQVLHLQYNGSFTISKPAWLQLSALLGSNSVALEVQPIGSLNLSAGTYTGDIVFKDQATGVEIGRTIVTYIVSDAVSLPYAPGAMAFTLDKLFVKLHSPVPGAYFSIALSAKVYPFNSEVFETQTLNFTAPLFQGSQKLNIGLPVDKLMKRMPNLDTHLTNPYKPAEVTLSVTEHRGTVTQSYYLQPIKFIAGLSPAMLRNNSSCFLDMNPNPRRATASSWTVINMYLTSFATIAIYRNSTLVSTMSFIAGLRSYRVNFETLGATQGDIFKFEMRPFGAAQVLSKYFKIFPEGYSSHYIVWEDEYKLRQVLECTGKLSVKSTVAHTTQELERDLVPVLEKTDWTKTTKLSINTGWLLATDKPSIESLMRAKRAALLLDGKTINLVPTSTEITNVDDDEATVAFDLEFQINRDYNEEIYLF